MTIIIDIAFYLLAVPSNICLFLISRSISLESVEGHNVVHEKYTREISY